MIDELDWKILKELQEDARIHFNELGKRVGLTSPAVIERIHKLEDTGVITGYRAEIDAAKMGLPVTAFILLKFPEQNMENKVMKVVEESHEIIECHKCAGESSYIMKVIGKSNEHVGEIVEKLLLYGMTTTSFVFSSPVKRRVIEKKDK